MTRVARLIHNAGKYLLISIYPLPTHPTHNFTHKNGGNLDTLPGWPKKLDHNRPARCAGQQDATLAASGVKIPVNVKMSAPMVARLFNLDRDMRTLVLTNPSNDRYLQDIWRSAFEAVYLGLPRDPRDISTIVSTLPTLSSILWRNTIHVKYH